MARRGTPVSLGGARSIGRNGSQEVADFESNPYFREAIQLRYWDDEAKIPQLQVPPLEHYRSHLVAVLGNEA